MAGQEQETLRGFIAKYGEPSKEYPVYRVGPEAENWPTVIVRAGNKVALVQFMNVGEGPNQHLCIDVHPFVDDQRARAAVFGMEVGRRLDGLCADQVSGTSHGLPAARQVSVLIGRQESTVEERGEA